jgi:hypothetical protein
MKARRQNADCREEILRSHFSGIRLIIWRRAGAKRPLYQVRITRSGLDGGDLPDDTTFNFKHLQTVANGFRNASHFIAFNKKQDARDKS